MFDLELIKIFDINEVSAKGGSIKKIINRLDNEYKGFGEIYISSVEKGIIKAWKYHKEMTLNLIVISGAIKFVFFNGKEFREIKTNSCSLKRIIVPPKVWYGFKGEYSSDSNILSLTNLIFKEEELERRNVEEISYDW
tara:strand:- start:2001 stop:2414 length:414 start_codon:yes stop_codon:yes gene_type:complete